MRQKHIVIAGAGFGGLNVALALERQFSRSAGISITLVDRHDYHLFTPALYEVATSEEEVVSGRQLRESITLPLAEVLAGSRVKFVKGAIQGVDQPEKKLLLEGKHIPYDYLVLALGSVSNYFGIPGAQQNSVPLKTLSDAMRIRNQVEFVLQLHRQDPVKKTVRVIVAGGGYTGIEFAAELSRTLEYVAWKNQYPRHKVELEVVEARNSLVCGCSERLGRDALARLLELGVRVRLNTPIANVNEHFVETLAGERVAYDVLVWAAGVSAKRIAFAHFMPVDRQGRLLVNERLQTLGDESIFALGDMAAVRNTNGGYVPGTAQDAWGQAKYVAAALPRILRNKRPKPYVPPAHGFIVSLGGKWAIMEHKGLYWSGFIAHLANQYAHFRYYRWLLGFAKAFKYVFLQWRVFGKND